MVNKKIETPLHDENLERKEQLLRDLEEIYPAFFNQQQEQKELSPTIRMKQIIFYISGGPLSSIDKTVLNIYYEITSEKDIESIAALGLILYKVMMDLSTHGKAVSIMFDYKNEELTPCVMSLSNIIGITTDIIAPSELIDKFYPTTSETVESVNMNFK